MSRRSAVWAVSLFTVLIFHAKTGGQITRFGGIFYSLLIYSVDFSVIFIDFSMNFLIFNVFPRNSMDFYDFLCFSLMAGVVTRIIFIFIFDFMWSELYTGAV